MGRSAPCRPQGAVPLRRQGIRYLKDGFRHVFVFLADGGNPRQLTSGDYHHEGPLSWSPDGTSLFFSANRSDNWQYEPRESEIYSVSVSDGSITRLTNRKGPDHAPVISSDGRTIAWLGFDDRKLSY